MASPSVVLETESGNDSTAMAFTVDTGGVQDGEGSIIVLSRDGGTGTVTFSDSYIELVDANDDDGFASAAVAYKQGGASEPSSITVTTTLSGEFTARAYRISGHLDFDTQAPDIGFLTDDGNVTTHNPPSVNVTGGPKDILSLAVLPFDTDGPTVSTFPTGYTNTGLTVSGSSGSQCSLAFCRRDLSSVSSEDPDAFTITATRRAIPITILIQEDAASGSAITADIDEAGDTTAAAMATIVSITANTAEEGDTTTAAISALSSSAITANVAEEGDTTSAAIAPIVGINANVSEAGDTTTATLATIVSINANVNELGDTTTAAISTSVAPAEITANVLELGDTTAAAISTGIAPAQITANIDELGDTTAAQIATIVSINANISELGDTTVAAISTGGELIAANAEINIFPAYSGRSSISPAYASKVDIS